MDREYACHCGLYCGNCGVKVNVEPAAKVLYAEMHKLGFDQIMPYFPNGEQFWTFLKSMTVDGVCVSCRAGSGNPGCQVRICAKEKGVEMCALCESYPCEHLAELFEGYPTLEHDNSVLREKGWEAWAKLQDERMAGGAGFCYKKTTIITSYMIVDKNILLKPLLKEDVGLFEKWLNKEYIFKWLCPGGEKDRGGWLGQVRNIDGEYDFMSHFIVYCGDKRIGYCLYVDCFFLKDMEEDGHDFEGLYGDVSEKNHTYEIGYLIGEEEYLGKGISKIIIRKLEEKITGLGGREIAADPSEENTLSIKALLSNGFKKKNDGDYRKTISR